MSAKSRILLAIASLGLLLVFVFPLWTIRLEAPQYPEGIGLQIRVNDIEGIKPHDLRNINGLNHYIGMQAIEPDSIPELKFMPWIVVGLTALGLGAAALGRRWALYSWFALLVLFAVAGLADFWLWEYNYGHNLDPNAAIKIPGMAYQPPLIGSKKLLNFVAHSWPGLGGWIAFLSMGLGAAAVVMEARRSRRASAEPVAARESVRVAQVPLEAGR